MTLIGGTRLGPYELVSLIGVGAMGEVYKARDTRLDRLVALKRLPEAFADRADRRARFRVEARAISSLGHPHICQLFDVGEEDGRPFLVMEYLDGETLDDRLSRGALSASDTLRYATQIADALDYLHGQSLVHRDLKPSNVMLTRSGVKLLDFGLAKMADPVPIDPLSTVSVERDLTVAGTVLGTFQYMAPEQLAGKVADPRTDIFAYGTLLYEMATGCKAFDGESQAGLIAAILTAEPPPVSARRNGSQLGHVAPSFDRLVERCLAKDPDARWQRARDIRVELEWIDKALASPSIRPSSWRGRLHRQLLPMGLTGAVAVTAGLMFRNTTEASPDAVRFNVVAPSRATIGIAENRTRLAIAPDGRQLAFVATRDGVQQIWLRSFDSIEASPLAGTEGAVSPFWSPDSRFIGFFSPGTGELRKIPVTGGPARTICAAQVDGGATWGMDGTILYTEFRQGLFRVSGDGGTPSRVTRVDKARGEMNHYWPSFLPDGRHFLYMATALDANRVRTTPTVYVASLDSPEIKPLARMHSKMIYTAPGYVWFVDDGSLLVQPFDTSALHLTGEPTRVADGVGYFRGLGNGSFSVSTTGTVVYQGSGDQSRLTWFDRRGVATAFDVAPQNFGSLRISRDARRVAVDVVDERTGEADIWLYDLTRGAPTRFTTAPGNENRPVWSPGAERIAFRDGRSSAPDVFTKTLDGHEEVLVAADDPLMPEDWSPDGRWFVYTNNTRRTGTDLWLLPLTGDRTPRPFVSSRFEEVSARFSPDSAWVAFVSTEFGPGDVYVAPVSGGAQTTRISVGGGSSPRWRADGKELFYLASDNRTIMAVSTELGPRFKAGIAAPLFTVGRDSMTFISRDRIRESIYDVTPDGQRFLISLPSEELASSRMTVVLNWMSVLKH